MVLKPISVSFPPNSIGNGKKLVFFVQKSQFIDIDTKPPESVLSRFASVSGFGKSPVKKLHAVAEVGQTASVLFGGKTEQGEVIRTDSDSPGHLGNRIAEIGKFRRRRLNGIPNTPHGVIQSGKRDSTIPKTRPHPLKTGHFHRTDIVDDRLKFRNGFDRLLDCLLKLGFFADNIDSHRSRL